MYVVYRSMWAYTYDRKNPDAIIGMATNFEGAYTLWKTYRANVPVIIRLD